MVCYKKISGDDATKYSSGSNGGPGGINIFFHIEIYKKLYN